MHRQSRLLKESDLRGYSGAHEVLNTIAKAMTADEIVRGENMEFYEALEFSRLTPGTSQTDR